MVDARGGVTYREWAPGAVGARLIGDFSECPSGARRKCPERSENKVSRAERAFLRGGRDDRPSERSEHQVRAEREDSSPLPEQSERNPPFSRAEREEISPLPEQSEKKSPLFPEQSEISSSRAQREKALLFPRSRVQREQSGRASAMRLEPHERSSTPRTVLQPNEKYH